MTTFKKFLFCLLGAYLLVVVPLAHAQNASGADGSPVGHVGQRIQEIYSQLDLTDDQKQKLEATKQQHRARTENARQEIKADKDAMRVELMKPQLDMARINVIHHQIKVLLSQMEDDKLNSILAVRTILTPDQFTKLDNLMHKHKQEHKN